MEPDRCRLWMVICVYLATVWLELTFHPRHFYRMNTLQNNQVCADISQYSPPLRMFGTFSLESFYLPEKFVAFYLSCFFGKIIGCKFLSAFWNSRHLAEQHTIPLCPYPCDVLLLRFVNCTCFLRADCVSLSCCGFQQIPTT